MRRRWPARVVLALALAAAVAAIAALITGGFRTQAWGLTISVRSAHKAAYVALILSVLGVWLHPVLSRAVPQRLATLPPSAFPLAASLLAGAVVGIATWLRPTAIGTADLYGYVTEAELWLKGSLAVSAPLGLEAPWPRAEWTVSPLGYKPGAPGTIVPSYPPGLPLLLALFRGLFGAGAEFLVTPICAGASVALTYALGARLFNRPVGLLAAALTAASPVFLMMACWLLGDLPTVPFWLASTLLALRAGTARAVFAGVLAGIAILIKPNLLPLIALPMIAVITKESGIRRRAIELLALALGTAPSVVFLGIVFDRLYGSPFLSGYGDTSFLFSLSHAPTNARQFAAWIFGSHGPFVLLALGAAIWPERLRWRSPAAFCLSAVFITWTCYLFYVPFPEWWFLRFLLPALPFSMMLVVAGAFALMQRVEDVTRRRMLQFAVFTLALGYGVSEAFERHVFAIGRRESRYAEAGAFLDRTLPANAILLTMVHSGAGQYYGRRPTLRFDEVDPQWLDRGIDWLVSRGYEPYVLIDKEERDLFVTRFAGQSAVEHLTPTLPASGCRHPIELYPLLRGSQVSGPIEIPIKAGC